MKNMQSRMKSPVRILPGALEAVQAIRKSTESGGVPQATLEFVHLRVGQINGCSVCVDMHARALKKMGESEVRIFAVAAWRDAPYYTGAERAALALAEAATRISDRGDGDGDGVPDEVWEAATRHFDEAALAALVLTIAVANLWNRLNVATRQVGGDWVTQYA
jgi:AhpD family alkylhydroperoxidase